MTMRYGRYALFYPFDAVGGSTMTRLPRTPLQDQAEKSREELIRYLLRQSEARQVMFLRSLSSDRLRYELESQLRARK